MSGEAVSQAVRVNLLLLETGAARSMLACVVDRLDGNGKISSMAACAREQPVRWFVLQSMPVFAQGREKYGAEHDVAIFPPLAAVNVNHHPLAVHVGDLQAGQFRAAHT